MLVSMRAVTFVLSCFACASYNHGDEDPMEALALSLLALRPTVQASHNGQMYKHRIPKSFQAQMKQDNGPASVDRRTALALGAALGSQFVSDAALADDVESTVPMEKLTAALKTSPKRSIVIAGCDSTVTEQCAKILVAAGHQVVCAAPSIAQARSGAAVADAYAEGNKIRKGGAADWAVLDLSSKMSILSFAKTLNATKIDTLILGEDFAGTGLARTEEGFEGNVGTNYLGQFYLANLLVPFMKQYGEKPRIVISTSSDYIGGSVGDLKGLAGGEEFDMVDGGGFNADKAYKDSKLCSMMFMEEAARRFEPLGITVNAVYPAFRDPGLNEVANFFSSDDTVWYSKYWAADYLDTHDRIPKEADFGGSALAYMATDPALDGTTGKWFDAVPGGTQLLQRPPQAGSAEMQQKLWSLSADLVGLNRRFVSP
jgi:protochlorophyllide reductase